MTGLAYYRFESKVVTRSQGQSSVAAAAYNAGELIKDERTGEIYDYRRKQHIYGSEILAPANAPEWVFDRKQLWNETECNESRKDSQVARQFILCFPACMTHAEKQAAARSFLQKECVARGMITDVAYHDFQGKDSNNPHAHVLLTMRPLEGKRFGPKARDWNNKGLHQEWREKWAEHLNHHLAQGGHQQRVDYRSYADQGLERTPGIHEGKALTAIREKIAKNKRQETTWLIERNDEIKALNTEILQLSRELKEFKKSVNQDNQLQTSPIAPDVIVQTGRQAAASLSPKPEPSRSDPAEVTAAIMALHHQSRTEFSKEMASRADIAVPAQAKRRIERSAGVNKQASDPSHPSPKCKGPDEPRDPTSRAVKRQLEAMGGDGYFEIGILDRKSGKMTERTWSREQICDIDPETKKSPIIQYLKAENAAGKDVFVRPAPLTDGRSQGVLLIDDIDELTVDDLKTRGLEPTLYVETSYRNGQAWVNVGRSLTLEETTQLAKLLAKEVGADSASASYQHYGRLAGFTNRKDERFDDRTGKYPWVRVLHVSPGQVATSADQYVELARRKAQEIKQEQEAAKSYGARLNREQVSADELRQAAALFLRLRLEGERKHSMKDPSGLDWVALKRMAKRGWKLEALEHALWESPELETRKKGHIEDYVRRTLDKLAKDPDVLAAYHRKAQRIQSLQPPAEKQPEQDQRRLIDQFQQYKDRERGSRASSSSHGAEQMRQSEVKPKLPSDHGKQKSMIDQRDIPVHALGSLDEKAVGWIIANTLSSDVAMRRLRNAENLSVQDTSHWKDQCRAEYIKELGRYLATKKAEAFTPYSDVEIAVKLRMAGWGKERIYKTLHLSSPFICTLDNDAKTRYLAKGIAPLIDNPKVNQQIWRWNQFRMSEAVKLPEPQGEAYLSEKRLDKLNLSLTRDRWVEQQRQHGRAQTEPEREL